MITIGIDPHKQTHTAVAVNEVGQLLGEVTVAGDEAGQRDLRSRLSRPTYRRGLGGRGLAELFLAVVYGLCSTRRATDRRMR